MAASMDNDLVIGQNYKKKLNFENDNKKLQDMKLKRVLGIAGAVLAAAVLGGCIYLNTLMPIITGYAAQNLASAVFVSGRDAATV